MPSFIKSAVFEKDWIHDSKNEICFVGRSNVGKSTTINALANSNICKTSKTPGRTQTINFFDFGDFRVVDLPGYGFANLSKSKIGDINQMLFNFISKRENIKIVFQICDVSVITNKDLEVSNFLSQKYEHHYILLNKIDKKSKSFFDNNKNKIAKSLNKSIEFMLPISSKNKVNIDKIKSIIKLILNGQ